MICVRGDFIVHKGDKARDMFFVQRGSIEICTEEGGKVLATLEAPSFFGDTAILQNSLRTASVQALTYVDMSRLSARALKDALAAFPDDNIRVRKNEVKV